MSLLKALSVFFVAEFFNVLLHGLIREATVFPVFVDVSSWIITAVIAFTAGWMVTRRMPGSRFLTLKIAVFFWGIGIVAFPILFQLLEYSLGKISAENLRAVTIGYLLASVPFFLLILGLIYFGAIASRRRA